jgi:hydrogenase maturation protease
VVVVGIGNEYRGDDAAGLLVARRLAGLDGVEVRESSGEGAALMEILEGAAIAILVDAARTFGAGAEPGSVRRFDASAGPLPASLARSSTHAFGVAEAVEMARALGRLPARTVVYAIEGCAFEAGDRVSPEVERGVDEACALVLEQLAVSAALSEFPGDFVAPP